MYRFLPQIHSGIDHYPLPRYPGIESLLGSIGQERAHIRDEIVVLRFGVPDTGADTDVGGNHRGAVFGGYLEIPGVFEAADVVRYHGTLLTTRIEHLGIPGIDADRQVKPLH